MTEHFPKCVHEIKVNRMRTKNGYNVKLQYPRSVGFVRHGADETKKIEVIFFKVFESRANHFLVFFLNNH
jgi:hypothetical protein